MTSGEESGADRRATNPESLRSRVASGKTAILIVAVVHLAGGMLAYLLNRSPDDPDMQKWVLINAAV